MTCDRRVGPLVDATHGERPGPVRARRPLLPDRELDAGDLHATPSWDAVEGDDRLWTYHGLSVPSPTRPPSAPARGAAMTGDDPLSYAIVDRASGAAIGLATLMEIRPAMRVIEMGNDRLRAARCSGRRIADRGPCI